MPLTYKIQTPQTTHNALKHLLLIHHYKIIFLMKILLTPIFQIPNFLFQFNRRRPFSFPSMFTTSTVDTITQKQQQKIVVIMGPTGCGKSKLSIDLATRFFPDTEIINSDKIQVYSGLNITTNKTPLPQRKNVKHHLLGEFDSSEFTLTDFRSTASLLISKIWSRSRIPFIVGGSNSFLYALLAQKFSPDSDVFTESGNSFFCKELRYKCCFIWVDVSQPVLDRYLVKRVDEMLESGMYDELAEFFAKNESDSLSRLGLRKAIGVPEFERYFRRFSVGDVEEREEYEKAVDEIKSNTCRLARGQLWKIQRLRDKAGWDLNRVDATSAVEADVDGADMEEAWENGVVEQSVKIVREFLME